MIWWCCSGICRALALLALLFPLQERSCWGLNPTSGDLEKSPHSDPDPWDVPHRNRRSWVWNQFFVLEEYTGNEPLYVGKVSDPLAQFSVLSYVQEMWLSCCSNQHLLVFFIYLSFFLHVCCTCTIIHISITPYHNDLQNLGHSRVSESCTYSCCPIENAEQMKTPNADSVGGHSALYCDKVEACAYGNTQF